MTAHPVTLLRRSPGTVEGRPALAAQWRERAADALYRAGVPVRLASDVVDGPQVAELRGELGQNIPAANMPAVADYLSHALNVPGVQLRKTGRILVIEVPWPTRRMVLASKMRSAGWRLQLGITPGGRFVDVDLTDSPHVLVAGKTGSGKSELLRTIGALLARGNAPDALPFVMVDRDRGHVQAFSTPLANLAHLAAPVAHDAAAARAVLEWVVRERIDGNAGPCAVFVDEAHWLRKDRAAVAALTDIAERGRKRGVQLIFGAQRTIASSIARDITVEFGVQVCGLVRDWRESVAVLGERGAERLLGKGDMLCRVGGGEVVRFQAAATLPGDVAGLPMRESVDTCEEVSTDENAPTVPWWQEPREMTEAERAWIVRNAWRDNKGRLRLPSRDDVIRQFNCGARVAMRWRAAVAADMGDTGDTGDGADLAPVAGSGAVFGALGPTVSARSA